MAETRSWFDRMKVPFLCLPKPKSQQDEKPKKWKCIFRTISFRQPSATKQETRTLDEAPENQRGQALNAAFLAAVAAAAEAAAASAKAAAEVVRLSATSSPISYHYLQCYVKSFDSNSAAIRIQTAFRAYLARKALRALKALVRLQAIVRGTAVRRRITFKFDRSDSLSIWDCSAFQKEDLNAVWLRTQEGVLVRDRTLEYSFSNQGRRSPGMHEEHLNQQKALKRTHPDLETIKTRNPAPGTLKTARTRDSNIRQHSSSSFSQRSFADEERNSVNGEIRVLRSEYHPTYMAATKSAKAKVRSVSTPRQRLGGKNED